LLKLRAWTDAARPWRERRWQRAPDTRSKMTPDGNARWVAVA
jgi:hypothetical protein